MKGAALDETLEYLGSPAALRALEEDPYWPKWDAPWWRITLLHELGLAARIPRVALEAMTAAMTRYLPFFPVRPSQLPPGADPKHDLACHCALGNICQALVAGGIDVDARLPWVRPWFLRYQLPDGGLNCDEAVYTRATPHSSFLSTLPALEAILFSAPRPLTADELKFLDRGAQYLIDRRLAFSLSKQRVADPGFLVPCFPRFYDYDVLRGLSFLVEWAEERGRELPAAALAPAVGALTAAFAQNTFRVGCAGEPTRALVGGQWRAGVPAKTFPLLDEVSAAPRAWLLPRWEQVRAALARR